MHPGQGCPDTVTCASEKLRRRTAQRPQVVDPAGPQFLRNPLPINKAIRAGTSGSRIKYAFDITRNRVGFQNGSDLAPGRAAIRAGENASIGRCGPKLLGIRRIELEVEDPMALQAGRAPAISAVRRSECAAHGASVDLTTSGAERKDTLVGQPGVNAAPRSAGICGPENAIAESAREKPALGVTLQGRNISQVADPPSDGRPRGGSGAIDPAAPGAGKDLARWAHRDGLHLPI